MGLKAIPMRADTGPIGGNLSHEFIILASTGESEVFCHADYLSKDVPDADVAFEDRAVMQGLFDSWTANYAATSEMHDAAAFDAIPDAQRMSARGIEVGHIFYFGTKYSEPMRAVVNGPDGKEHIVQMGSYGIGPSRLVAALIEANHDENGIIWPESVAPFRLGLANLKVGDAATDAACADLYAKFEKAGIDTLYDDRDERPGAKFATMDLIGLPDQVIIGPKGLAEGKIEVKNRRSGARENLSIDEVLNKFTA
jgi:prolyl-tRNA synthetase